VRFAIRSLVEARRLASLIARYFQIRSRGRKLGLPSQRFRALSFERRQRPAGLHIPDESPRLWHERALLFDEALVQRAHRILRPIVGHYPGDAE
jgi:hypothetical protein